MQSIGAGALSPARRDALDAGAGRSEQQNNAPSQLIDIINQLKVLTNFFFYNLISCNKL